MVRSIYKHISRHFRLIPKLPEIYPEGWHAICVKRTGIFDFVEQEKCLLLIR